MTKLIGRFSCTDRGRSRRIDSELTSHERFEREIYGTDGETEEERARQEAEARRRRGETCDCNADEEMTPIKKFKAASDKRWGIGTARSRAADGAPKLPKDATATQKFIAASNARHGIRG